MCGFLCRFNALRMDCAKALPCLDRIADLLFEDNADGKVDDALLRGSAAAEMH